MAMSNHLALATVTAVLRKTLQDALDAAEPGVSAARTTTLRPNAPQADLPNPGVNIYLYQTTPSPSLRNADLPTRRIDGALAQRPQVALDLHYLVTFHGNDARLEPQILHGITTRALHEAPVLTRAMIEATLGDQVFDFLEGSDLADAIEMVRFSPIGLSVEEMSKLWSVFFQTPYVLSVAYRASVVLIESAAHAATALPVRARRVRAMASTGPAIEKVLAGAAADEQDWITAADDLVLVGRNLRSAVTRVLVGGVEVAPEPAAMSAERIQVAMPASLTAGVHGVQVVHRSLVTPSPLDVASGVAPFVLHPTVQAQQVGATVRATIAPAVGRTQQVTLLLNESPAPSGRAARSYAFQAPTRELAAPATVIDVPVTGVAAGTYLVRIRVDGAESPLGYDEATGRYAQPVVTIA
jgi:hypothetical protein